MEQPNPTPQGKSGVKTSEFWLTAFLTIFGVVGPMIQQWLTGREEPWAQIAGAILAGLSTSIYTWTRSNVKVADANLQESLSNALGARNANFNAGFVAGAVSGLPDNPPATGAGDGCNASK